MFQPKKRFKLNCIAVFMGTFRHFVAWIPMQSCMACKHGAMQELSISGPCQDEIEVGVSIWCILKYASNKMGPNEPIYSKYLISWKY